MKSILILILSLTGFTCLSAQSVASRTPVIIDSLIVQVTPLGGKEALDTTTTTIMNADGTITTISTAYITRTFTVWCPGLMEIKCTAVSESYKYA